MKKWTAFFVLVAGVSILTSLTSPLLAHHGRGATYDLKRQLSLKGTVAEVLWRNPHVVIFLDARDDNGTVVRWTIEHSNITTLARLGYGKNSLRAGQDVTAVVHPGAQGTPIALCAKIVFPDGKEIFERAAGVD
jgi:hypothetical protein